MESLIAVVLCFVSVTFIATTLYIACRNLDRIQAGR